MKQFMTLSAFVLSAACICANTQSFASTSHQTNDNIVTDSENLGNQAVRDSEKTMGTIGSDSKNVLNKAAKGIEGVAKGISNMAVSGVRAIDNSTKNMMHGKNVAEDKNHSKESTEKNTKHALKKHHHHHHHHHNVEKMERHDDQQGVMN